MLGTPRPRAAHGALFDTHIIAKRQDLATRALREPGADRALPAWPGGLSGEPCGSEKGAHVFIRMGKWFPAAVLTIVPGGHIMAS